MVTGERKEVGGGGVCACVRVCNSHRQVPSNKARSVLPQVQRERGGMRGEEGKEEEDKEGG